MLWDGILSRKLDIQRKQWRKTISPIEHFWVIRWDRAGQQLYISEQVMHRPYADVYISKEESGIQCTFRGRRGYRAER